LQCVGTVQQKFCSAEPYSSLLLIQLQYPFEG
jgi:hypothetical protein